MSDGLATEMVEFAIWTGSWYLRRKRLSLFMKDSVAQTNIPMLSSSPIQNDLAQALVCPGQGSERLEVTDQ